MKRTFGGGKRARKTRVSPAKPIPPRVWKIKPGVIPPFDVKSLDDLIDLAWNYQTLPSLCAGLTASCVDTKIVIKSSTDSSSNSVSHAVDWEILWGLIPVLSELANVVGMEDIKRKTAKNVMCHLQGLDNVDGDNDDDFPMKNVIISGPPGVGKSMVARILAKIDYRLGVLPTEKFVALGREDLIGKYIGHSEANVKKALHDAIGGTMFIDEAQSMGQKKDPDSFSKAMADVICKFLVEHKRDFKMYIAGYLKEIKECFLSLNKGLERRFTETMHIEGYTPAELAEMFRRRVAKAGWSIEKGGVPESIFVDNKELFEFYGGDVETFVIKCKEEHAFRIFGFSEGVKCLTTADIDAAINTFRKHKGVTKEKISPEIARMYC